MKKKNIQLTPKKSERDKRQQLLLERLFEDLIHDPKLGDKFLKSRHSLAFEMLLHEMGKLRKKL